MFRLIILMTLSVSLSFAVVKSGDKIIDFSLPNLHDSNKKISISSTDSKVILLNLWASWCPGCKAEMPQFIKLQGEFDKNDFTLITVNVDSKSQKAIEYLSKLEKKVKLPVNFITAYDEDKSVVKAYKPRGLPASYLIVDGKIKKAFLGSFTDKSELSLENEIRSLIK